MFDKKNRLESLPSRKRYLYGKQIEELVKNSLKQEGLIIKDVDRNTDCEDKIDCIILENDQEKKCQIKCRMGYSGSDVLVDLWSPFYGIDNPATKEGRDHIGKYEIYIVLINETIYVIDGIIQKKIIQDVLEEWKVSHYQLPVFDSYRYKGVQLRYSIDRSNKRPKVLMFIPIKTYEGDEIKEYKMK